MCCQRLPLDAFAKSVREIGTGYCRACASDYAKLRFWTAPQPHNGDGWPIEDIRLFCQARARGERPDAKTFVRPKRALVPKRSYLVLDFRGSGSGNRPPEPLENERDDVRLAWPDDA